MESLVVFIYYRLFVSLRITIEKECTGGRGGEEKRKEEGKRRKIGMVIYDKRNGIIMVAE